MEYSSRVVRELQQQNGGKGRVATDLPRNPEALKKYLKDQRKLQVSQAEPMVPAESGTQAEPAPAEAQVEAEVQPREFGPSDEMHPEARIEATPITDVVNGEIVIIGFVVKNLSGEPRTLYPSSQHPLTSTVFTQLLGLFKTRPAAETVKQPRWFINTSEPGQEL